MAISRRLGGLWPSTRAPRLRTRRHRRPNGPPTGWFDQRNQLTIL